MNLEQIYNRLLAGETVEVGIFRVWEDYLYTGSKDDVGNPKFQRVLKLVYFDEDEDDYPSEDDFDGTYQGMLDIFEEHGILEDSLEDD